MPPITSPNSPASSARPRAKPRACLGINNDPVTIKQIEASIVDKAWNEGWVTPEPPAMLTGKKVADRRAPARPGLACAQQLARAGHSVTVYERADRIGGLLRYGIPDFKMEKRHLDRRLEQMKAEGVDLPAVDQHRRRRLRPRKLLDRVRRRLPLRRLDPAARPADRRPRTSSGIDFAMQYLTGQNRRGAGDSIDDEDFISARGKTSIIIGGGDTGADCLGTVHRQGARAFINSRSCRDRPTIAAPHNPVAAVVQRLPRLIGP